MKLSENTVEILKNFSTINQSLLVKVGSVLSTVTPTKTVLATARVEEDFPNQFAIYDLNKFLAKLSLYKDCALVFHQDRVEFRSEDGRRSDYIKFCSPQVIVSPPDKTLTLDNPDYEFNLSAEDLQWQRKSAGISGSPHIGFRGDGEKVYLVSTDMKDDASDMSKTEIAATEDEFEAVIKVENLKIVDGSYKVLISKQGFVKFVHATKSLEYFVAFESTLSSFK